MRDRLPTFISLLLLALLVLATLWAVDYTQRSVALDPPRRVTHEPDSWSRNFTMVSTDASGMAINRLDGEMAYHYPDDDSYEIEHPRAVSNRAQSPMTVATSDTAHMNAGGDTITMTGNAHIHRQATAEDEALDVRSRVLIILPQEDVVYTNEPAVVVNGQSTLRGTGMRYDNRVRQLNVMSESDTKISGQQTQKTRSPNSSKDSQP